MLILSRVLHNVRRSWERSLRRFNKRSRWVLWKWLVKGDYTNLKFTEYKRIELIKRQFDLSAKPLVGNKYCDMQALHEQDMIARSTRKQE